MSLWGVVFLSVGLASAGPQLRGPATENEREAQAFRDLAHALGLETRVQRTYQHGLGWEYSVWVSGFDSEEGARAVADHLAERGGRGVDVLVGGGMSERPLPEPLAELPEAGELRSRVARALGGRGGGRARLREAESLKMVFTRILPKAGVNVRHRLLRAANFRSLEVEQMTNAGPDFLAIRGPSGDWLREQDELVPVGSARMDELFERMSPEGLYASVLDLPGLLLDDVDYQGLRVVGQEIVDYRNAIRLESQGRHGKIVLLVEVGSWLPRSLGFHTDGGRTQRLFVGWRAIESNLILPGVMEVHREGQIIDRIHLDEIQLSPTLSSTDFSLPEMP